MNILAQNLTKSYRQTILFENVSFSIEKGTHFGISGHNGSGKSTLLKMIAGYVTPDSGELDYVSEEKKIPPSEWYHHLVISAPYLEFPSTLDIENLWQFHFHRKKKKDVSLDEMAEEFQLPLHIPLSDFSSGMIQRAKLMLVFSTDIEILLFDEPTELLDEMGISIFKKWILGLDSDQIAIISSNKSQDFVNCHQIFNVSS